MRPVLETVLPWQERGISFIGDPHIGKNADLTERLRLDLEDAKKRGDLLAIWGDVHDWILPSDRKRYTSGKHNKRVDAIINETVAMLADFFEPFVDNIAVMKLGNHETSVIKYHHVDPMQMLISELNRRRDSKLPPIFYGGYTMWWLLRFVDHSPGGKRTGGANCKVWMHHGAGGSAPVTRGSIDRARIYDAITADVAVIGHKHQSLHITTKHERLDDYGNVRREDRDFLLLAGYSGWDNSTRDDNGYILDWSAESFYGLESTGYKRMSLKPQRTSKGSKIIRVIEGRSE
jgi:hypothetical protein